MSKESACNQHKKYPSIKLSSCPFILEEKIGDEINKIAVFLMDSDIVFDHEITSRTIEDIMALFLLTSSTIIYNSKYNLEVIQKFCLIKKYYLIKTLFFISQIKDLLKLQNSISRISILDNSMNILQKVLFLIRN
jgi:hypothetical protein